MKKAIIQRVSDKQEEKQKNQVTVVNAICPNCGGFLVDRQGVQNIVIVEHDSKDAFMCDYCNKNFQLPAKIWNDVYGD